MKEGQNKVEYKGSIIKAMGSNCLLLLFNKVCVFFLRNGEVTLDSTDPE